MKISIIDFLPAINYVITKSDNRGQIISLFQNLLNRQPTETEITKYLNRTNDEIVNEISVSDEYIQLKAEKGVTTPSIPVPAFSGIKPIGWGLIVTGITWVVSLF